MPAQTDGGFWVDAEGARLWSIAFGPADAPAFVAVGGWTGSWELWVGPFGILSARWRCIGFDHRGAGSTICEPKAITFDALVDDVFAVMDARGIERAVIGGESAGAVVVLGAAARRPERVAGIVLVDAFRPTRVPTDDDSFPRALRTDYESAVGAFVDACLPDLEHSGLRRWGRQILARSTPELAIALLKADAHDPAEDLGRITAPALLIHCEGDRLAPVDASRTYAALLPAATLHVVAGNEHVPTMTRPAEVAGLIEEWLETLPG